MVGLSLGIQSADFAHTKDLDKAISAGRVRISAPWYIATNADRFIRNFAGQLRHIRIIAS